MNHPDPRTPIDALLTELYARHRGLNEGKLAAYIPELAKANPDCFAIAVCTPAGEIHQIGDIEQIFTIQSVSKPFVHGLALDDHGRDFVTRRVGVEPTGDAFNSIITLEERSKRPHNPMVNAGAIAMASLLKGGSQTERLNRLLEGFSRYTGHRVNVDMSVFMSERTTGHRNRAIAHLMLNFGMIEGAVDEALDLYFQQCSILVTCRDLAVMAGTLANQGRNPLTGAQAVQREHVKDILSVMYTCGMYDYSGEWVYRVGLPAKSGVGGGIIAVVPGKLGIAVFSPPLDERGNSVRGIAVCRDLSERLGLHLFDSNPDAI
ncbi:MAG: glutaminase A [Candidatus Sericytochromatia bacterium]|nr:glutaminase A [Candidatus Sericytochromatia bacterium]